MNDVVEKAKKRIAEIEAEAQRLRTFLAVYKALESSDSVLIGDSASAEVVRDGHFTPSRTTSKPSEIIKAAKSTIRDRGRPLTRTQLVQMLEAQGLVIGGADKSKNMGTILWRSNQFDNVEGEGYWPKDAPPWGAATRHLDLG